MIGLGCKNQPCEGSDLRKAWLSMAWFTGFNDRLKRFWGERSKMDCDGGPVFMIVGNDELR